MDIVTILRELWRLRIPVAAVALIAVVIGGLIAYRAGVPPQRRQYEIGVATARALVDTPSSQVADLGIAKEGTDPVSLPTRAALLANLLTTSPLREEIAERSGVSPDRLIAVADTPTDFPQQKKAPLTSGATVSADDSSASVLTVHTDAELPFITVDSQAPNARTAARLADDAIDVLEEHLATVVNDEGVPATRRLVVKKLGAAGAATETRGPSRMVALIVAFVLFGVGCALVVGGSALAREWRRASAFERALGDPDLPSPGSDDDDQDSGTGSHPGRRRDGVAA